MVAAAVGEVAMDGVAVGGGGGGSEGAGVKGGGEWAVATSDRWAAAL